MSEVYEHALDQALASAEVISNQSSVISGPLIDLPQRFSVEEYAAWSGASERAIVGWIKIAEGRPGEGLGHFNYKCRGSRYRFTLDRDLCRKFEEGLKRYGFSIDDPL